MVARERDMGRIRALNEELRTGGLAEASDTFRWVLTAGVMGLDVLSDL